MKIILVRHGAYSPMNVDPEEGLSSIGKEEVKGLSKILIAKQVTFDHIFCSPKKRALETCAILSKDSPFTITDLLKGGENPQKILDFIAHLDGTILLVGHNPFMEFLAEILDHPISFETASCVIFDNHHFKEKI